MKIKKFLGFIALAVAVLLPMSAKAATWGMAFEKTEETADSFTVTIKAKQDQAGAFTAGVYTATMSMEEGAQFDTYTSDSSGKWTVTVSGNTITMVLSENMTETEGVVGTLTFKKVGTENCRVEFICEGKTTTVDPTPENPKTGNVLPYAVIGVGMALAGVVYYVTRKNNKLYNI